MGCLQSRSERQETPKEESEEGAARPKYSWEKREKVNPKDFTIENLNGETAGRVPGTINGQQFIIKDCQNSNIYIYDHSAMITVDDCIQCRIFLGPIKGSVFIRDCKECQFVIACQQFRTRDCQKMDVFLSCATQPIIEATTGVKFGCFRYHYPELEEQFRKAELSIYNNNWSQIHDFTPVPGENNFTLLPQEAQVIDHVPLPTTEQFSSMQISVEPDQSAVPQTLGSRRKNSDEGCLVVFFNDGGSHERARNLIVDMKEKHPNCMLVRTKELPMEDQDAVRVFGSEAYIMAVQQGPVIGLEYNGDGCLQGCQETCIAISKGTTGVVFVSSGRSAAAQQIENFFNFADMQMGA